MYVCTVLQKLVLMQVNASLQIVISNNRICYWGETFFKQNIVV